jgi:hypothetical protein
MAKLPTVGQFGLGAARRKNKQETNKPAEITPVQRHAGNDGDFVGVWRGQTFGDPIAHMHEKNTTQNAVGSF